jgi:hypothetical protein
MKAVIAKEIDGDPSIGPAVAEANNLLSSILGPSAGLVSAKWTIENGSAGRKLISLSLSDWTGSVSARFAPEDLARPYQLYSRLDRLWGELLKVRSHQLISNVLQDVNELEKTASASENQQ